MKMKLAALSMLLAAGLTQANAQINSKYQSDSRHEFRIGYSDGLTLSVASIWGIGLGDAVTGTTRTNETSTGVLGLGYRYHMNRFRLGLDLASPPFRASTTTPRASRRTSRRRNSTSWSCPWPRWCITRKAPSNSTARPRPA